MFLRLGTKHSLGYPTGLGEKGIKVCNCAVTIHGAHGQVQLLKIRPGGSMERASE